MGDEIQGGADIYMPLHPPRMKMPGSPQILVKIMPARHTGRQKSVVRCVPCIRERESEPSVLIPGLPLTEIKKIIRETSPPPQYIQWVEQQATKRPMQPDEDVFAWHQVGIRARP